MTTLVDLLDLLHQIVHESPYLSVEGRKDLAQEVHALSGEIEEGKIPFSQGEQTLLELNKRAATDEIQTLMTKIGRLNPSSPRLEGLRILQKKLREGVISANEARSAIHEMMLSVSTGR